MISPTQAIMAGALTLAATGLMLVGSQSSDPPILPGAEGTGSGEATLFEGFFRYGSDTQPATSETLDNGVQAHRDQIWTIYSAETSDPRFGGTVTNTWSYDEYTGDDAVTIWTGGWNITNDEGGWQQRPIVNLGYPDGTYTLYTAIFDGVDGFDGLTAIVEVDEDPGRGGFGLRGMVFDGPLPPVPALLQQDATE
ncbi:MAG: hypothetical protein AB1Z67_08460 [Candidatus Limnocylindrales bacterium]